MSPEQYLAHSQRVLLRAVLAEQAMSGIDVWCTGYPATPHPAAVEKFLFKRGQSVRDAS